ncbi:protein kinase [Actinidia rufa]|uniref:Protein kinase n=1 Tax=Actinidia rufa TaxID=165716 RepID=A0A7J0F236_9ERIC|nr:protein kinase [Actinidia rufa]
MQKRLSGFEVGDWVRSKPTLGTRPSYDWNSIGKESIAVVHSIQDNGYLELACCFRKGKWITHYTDIEKLPCFKIGQHVRFRVGLAEPRWGWRGAQSNSQGLWRGDPADLEIEQMFEVGDWVRMRSNTCSWKSVGPCSIGVVQGNAYEGMNGMEVYVWDFCGEQEGWVGPCSHLDRGTTMLVLETVLAIDADGKLRIYTPAGSKAWLLDPSEVELVEKEEIHIGDWVKVRASVSTPTHQWGDVSHSSIGVVHRIEDGELWVAFCFMDRLWLCKEGEMERVRPFKVGDNVRIREGLVTPPVGMGDGDTWK